MDLFPVEPDGPPLFQVIRRTLLRSVDDEGDELAHLLADRVLAWQEQDRAGTAEETQPPEPDPQRVDLERLDRIRGIGAVETGALDDWYAQQE